MRTPSICGDHLGGILHICINRTPGDGSVLKRRMVAEGDGSHLHGAPAHRSATTRQWCRDYLPNFWSKEEYPGNSPGLNPMEQLSAMGDRPKRPQQTGTNNQPRAAKDVAQVCVVTNPAVCALPSRGQYAEPCSQVFVFP